MASSQVQQSAKEVPVPQGIQEKIARAKRSIEEGSLTRHECYEFWKGNQYVDRSVDGYLVKQGTITGERPAHRPRKVRNLLKGLVEGKVSAACQRVPSYEINPTSTDAEDISAAMLATKVALYGYEKWGIRRVTRDVVTNAIVMDGGYAMPYWDSSVPPFIDDQGTGIGEVKVRTFNGNEVGWEPGVKFHESPWHVVMQGRLAEEIQAMPGFIPGDGPLQPDAQTFAPLNSGATKNDSKLVMVYEYLERPTPKFVNGRRIVIANDRLILPVEDYPCASYGFDGPVIHELVYTIDPVSDRGLGVVADGLDAQRTFNSAGNQQESWAQLALNPQIIGPPLAKEVTFTDEPGVYIPVVPINGMVPQWRDVPPMPPELSQMKEEARMDLFFMFSADDIPEGVESSKGIQAALEMSRMRWSSFLLDLAGWHAELMRHCLLLCQEHYTEPRLMAIRGRFGWEQIPDFRGADINNQVDVVVLPGSIEPRTRESILNKLNWIAQTFPGYLSPEAAMAALEGGTGEKLIESYELDVARANMMLQKILAGPDVLFAEPLTDPTRPPSWAPRPFDNVAVHMAIFADFMKTPEFDRSPPEAQEATRLYYDGCEYLKDFAEARKIEAQNQMAMEMGAQNAARQPGPKPVPSTSTEGPGGAD